MRIDPKQFIEVIEAAEFEPRSYSGRGMYGKECVGVTLDRGTSSFELGVKLCAAALDCLSDDDAHNFIEEMSMLRTCEDSMGLGGITYWPEVAWVGEKDEDEDDEPGQLQACES